MQLVILTTEDIIIGSLKFRVAYKYGAFKAVKM